MAENEFLGLALRSDAAKPLGFLQDILQKVKERILSETCGQRAVIEEQAVAAIVAFSAQLPRLWRWFLRMVGPAAVDLVLDELCGPD